MKDKEFDKKIEQVEDYIKCEMDKVVEDFMAGRLKETPPEYSREKIQPKLPDDLYKPMTDEDIVAMIYAIQDCAIKIQNERKEKRNGIR